MSSKDKKIKVGFSIGDLNGIGGELILKSLCDKHFLELYTPIVYASSKLMDFLSQYFEIPISYKNKQTAETPLPNTINVVNVWEEAVEIHFGEPTTASGRYAILSLESAVNDLKSAVIDVLVTSPVNKHNIQSDTFQFPGHTDYLNKELQGDSLMFMISDKLRIGLLTDHVSIAEVTPKINEALICKKVETIYQSLKYDFGIKAPKIAVLGLNPHAGDNGVIGTKDDLVLKPELQRLKASGIGVEGPYSADSFFGSDAYKNFDAILAAYHDQGLIPFKTLTFGSGVNFTAGLDKVRTSPDHGTAYEIAGQGIANTASFRKAIYCGIAVFRQRQIHQ
ncbi:MAG: 4-hydroxythreonine-4-phosphate dehydrogenase PdxA [Bacteroidota bacterium]|nr:4-hydroxythreonine-4-phosphate dehydrogenase PdxA [Bacteroidota bacterium]